ncbi:nucleoside/nucleotide kinase family protein [Aestuariimicrobium ganziense]|uniref:cobalt ABC transporter n=1 Tax=Aestuariimicrobium ganziense TaxID=2773677 RepID=UPI00194142CE|nr:cobalt ABC transporter [Aestuariimicrobium ganziense]
MTPVPTTLPRDTEALAEALLALTPTGDHPRILLDGGSGSGKTSLSHDLAAAMAQQGTPITVVSLDRVYPGWSGLSAASLMVPGMLTGRRAHPTWDWDRGRVGDWVDLPDGAILVEGCGAITPANRALATATVWCDLDATSRRTRALDRDGEGFRPWWQHWAAQEAWHWQWHRPRALADLTVDMR